MQRDNRKAKVGNTIAEYFGVEVPNDCCNIYKTINAFGPSLLLIHIRTIATLLMDQHKIDQSKYPLVKLLIMTAVAENKKKIK